jgi:hypothetical protein
MNHSKQVSKFIQAMVNAEQAPNRDQGLKAVKQATKASKKLTKGNQ